MSTARKMHFGSPFFVASSSIVKPAISISSWGWSRTWSINTKPLLRWNRALDHSLTIIYLIHEDTVVKGAAPFVLPFIESSRAEAVDDVDRTDCAEDPLRCRMDRDSLFADLVTRSTNDSRGLLIMLSPALLPSEVRVAIGGNIASSKLRDWRQESFFRKGRLLLEKDLRMDDPRRRRGSC